MPGWNIADVLEAVAGETPERPMLVQGDRRLSWEDVDARADQLGSRIRAAGLGEQDAVALYLRNSIEYLEGFLAALKARLIPVNTNYRYVADELVYLWRDGDVRAVVFDAEFADLVDRVRDRVPDVSLWVCVGAGPVPAWAKPYDELVTTDVPTEPPPGPGRDGDDLLLLYTGGTTGMPKGVMWRQDDVLHLLGDATRAGYGKDQDLQHVRSQVADTPRSHVPAAPLMHGAGIFTCLPILMRGGTIVLLEHPTFDPVELLDVIEAQSVFSASWVGDAFGKPVLEALDAQPDRWDLSSWQTIMSGGVLFSEGVKRGLLRHLPGITIVDMFGASEAIAGGRSIMTAEARDVPAGSFRPRADVRVLDEHDHDVAPGEVGRLAYGGRQPLGYYKDEAKTAATFAVIDGRRYCLPGDWARRETDGTITLIGRGSSVINSGGEKIFPEEVEEILARHPAVRDVIVLGVPHERFGEQVVALVQPAAETELDAESLMEHAKARLAGFKAPRLVLAVDAIERAPSGKPDLARMRELARQLMAQ